MSVVYCSMAAALSCRAYPAAVCRRAPPAAWHGCGPTCGDVAAWQGICVCHPCAPFAVLFSGCCCHELAWPHSCCAIALSFCVVASQSADPPAFADAARVTAWQGTCARPPCAPFAVLLGGCCCHELPCPCSCSGESERSCRMFATTWQLRMFNGIVVLLQKHAGLYIHADDNQNTASKD